MGASWRPHAVLDRHVGEPPVRGEVPAEVHHDHVPAWLQPVAVSLDRLDLIHDGESWRIAAWDGGREHLEAEPVVGPGRGTPAVLPRGDVLRVHLLDEDGDPVRVDPDRLHGRGVHVAGEDLTGGLAHVALVTQDEDGVRGRRVSRGREQEREGHGELPRVAPPLGELPHAREQDRPLRGALLRIGFQVRLHLGQRGKLGVDVRDLPHGFPDRHGARYHMYTLTPMNDPGSPVHHPKRPGAGTPGGGTGASRNVTFPYHQNFGSLFLGNPYRQPLRADGYSPWSYTLPKSTSPPGPYPVMNAPPITTLGGVSSTNWVAQIGVPSGVSSQPQSRPTPTSPPVLHGIATPSYQVLK